MHDGFIISAMNSFRDFRHICIHNNDAFIIYASSESSALDNVTLDTEMRYLQMVFESTALILHTFFRVCLYRRLLFISSSFLLCRCSTSLEMNEINMSVG